MKNKDIVICDIDGTVSLVGERLKYLRETPPDWDAFYNDCFDDEPITEMCDLVNCLIRSGYRIIFCTGRRDTVRDKTERWIQKHLFYRNTTPEILMRPERDHRHDVAVKPALLDEFLTHEERERIAFILEDRDSMVKKWRELGYRCLQVDSGDF